MTRGSFDRNMSEENKFPGLFLLAACWWGGAGVEGACVGRLCFLFETVSIGVCRVNCFSLFASAVTAFDFNFDPSLAKGTKLLTL